MPSAPTTITASRPRWARSGRPRDVQCALGRARLVQLHHVDDVALNGRMALELPVIELLVIESVDEVWQAWSVDHVSEMKKNTIILGDCARVAENAQRVTGCR